jgi:hypothetical protein
MFRQFFNFCHLQLDGLGHFPDLIDCAVDRLLQLGNFELQFGLFGLLLVPLLLRRVQRSLTLFNLGLGRLTIEKKI